MTTSATSNTNINLYAKQLLERLGNSIYERGALDAALFTFNSKEICIVEDWIQEFLIEAEAPEVETNEAPECSVNSFAGILYR